jgi:hypothetical protein
MGMRPGKAKAPWVGISGGGGTPTSLTTTPTWLLFTVTHTQLQAAALTNDIELWSMPALGVIHAVLIEPTTQFAGAAITDYKVAVGLTGFLTKYHSFFDVDTAVAATNFSAADILAPENRTAVTSIRIAAISVGANLSASTAGVVNIAILASKWR